MTMRSPVSLVPVGLLGVALLSSMPAAAAPKLTGHYASPLGTVLVNEGADGVVTAKLAKKGACGGPGTRVFEGARLDDTLVGTIHACQIGDGCAGDLDGDMMLIVNRTGQRVSGAVHLKPNGACKTPIGTDNISFQMVKTASSAPPKAKVPTKSARAKAEALAKEADTMMRAADSNVEGARAKFQEAVQIDPSFSQGYTGLGVTYYQRDRYDEALDAYKKAIEIDPANHDAYYNIACVYALKGDADQALRFLKIAFLNGYVNLETLSTDQDLKNLAGNPEFEKLRGAR